MRIRAGHERANRVPRQAITWAKIGCTRRSGSTHAALLRQSAGPHRAPVITNADGDRVGVGLVIDRRRGRRRRIRIAREERPCRAQLPIERELGSAVAPIGALDLGHTLGVDPTQVEAAGDARRHHARPRHAQLVARSDEACRIGTDTSSQLRTHGRALRTLCGTEGPDRRVVGTSDPSAFARQREVCALRAAHNSPSPKLGGGALIADLDTPRIGYIVVELRLVARRERSYTERAALTAKLVAVLAADFPIEEVRPPRERVGLIVDVDDSSVQNNVATAIQLDIDVRRYAETCALFVDADRARRDC